MSIYKVGQLFKHDFHRDTFQIININSGENQVIFHAISIEENDRSEWYEFYKGEENKIHLIYSDINFIEDIKKL